MSDWVSHLSRVQPENTALIDAPTARSWTYGELHVAVNRVAQVLTERDVSPGDRVATLLPKSPHHVTMIWGILRTGATVIPMNPSEPAAQLKTRLDLADVGFLIQAPDNDPTGPDFRGTDDLTVLDIESIGGVKSVNGETEALHRFNDQFFSSTGGSDSAGSSTESGGWSGSSPECTDRILGLDSTRIILFTSGTTGDPKGVRLTLRNIATSAAGSAFRLGVVPGDKWLLSLPMYHMGGLSIPLRAAIYGTTVVIQPEFEAESTLDTMEKLDITGISLVPTMLERLLEVGQWPDSVRFALVGGAPTPPSLARKAINQGVPLYTTYGMTETASQIATAAPEVIEANPETVGRPLRTARVHILGEDGVESPTGERGEIAVSGPIVSPGYVDETDRRDPEDRFLTGDVGYIDQNGLLYVTGRVDEQIITGGENVHPGEIRDAIVGLQGVEEATVVGLPDEEWGQRVAAAVVVTQGGPGPETIRKRLRTDLVDYKVPKTVELVESISRTASGTVDKEAVKRQIDHKEE